MVRTNETHKHILDYKNIGTEGEMHHMTKIMSKFVSSSANAAALFGFLTYVVFTIRSIILTRMLLKHGKKHAKIAKNLIKF